jgi:hypothetical protein
VFSIRPHTALAALAASVSFAGALVAPHVASAQEGKGCTIKTSGGNIFVFDGDEVTITIKTPDGHTATVKEKCNNGKMEKVQSVAPEGGTPPSKGLAPKPLGSLPGSQGGAPPSNSAKPSGSPPPLA